jgi:hypothetical protein
MMRRQKQTIFVLGVITAFVASVLFLPRLVSAGDLEPPAAPGPTMKTLDQIPPTWSLKLDSPDRFELVLDDSAALDKETGLVWALAPSTSPMFHTWWGAWEYCLTYRSRFGKRMGWRLAKIEELYSLLDVLNTPLALPTGHPFISVDYTWMWSATTRIDHPGFAYIVDIRNGDLQRPYDKGREIARAWCVRGGCGNDPY